jgi:hypothetical protein
MEFDAGSPLKTIGSLGLGQLEWIHEQYLTTN